jgi:hypothetical protein
MLGAMCPKESSMFHTLESKKSCSLLNYLLFESSLLFCFEQLSSAAHRPSAAPGTAKDLSTMSSAVGVGQQHPVAARQTLAADLRELGVGHVSAAELQDAQAHLRGLMQLMSDDIVCAAWSHRCRTSWKSSTTMTPTWSGRT